MFSFACLLLHDIYSYHMNAKSSESYELVVDQQRLCAISSMVIPIDTYWLYLLVFEWLVITVSFTTQELSAIISGARTSISSN